MNELKNAMAASASAMGAQSLRLRLVAENLANAETPGYRRKTVPFETVIDRSRGVSLVEPGRVQLDSRDGRELYEPSHPLADERGMLTLSNVDPLIELADAREAQRSYEASVGMFDRARRLRSEMLDLLRR